MALEPLKHLQPNRVGVWRFQAWNQSYNVSAEWDDYRDRYYWVVKGMDYLNDGMRYNKNDQRLVSDAAPDDEGMPGTPLERYLSRGQPFPG